MVVRVFLHWPPSSRAISSSEADNRMKIETALVIRLSDNTIGLTMPIKFTIVTAVLTSHFISASVAAKARRSPVTFAFVLLGANVIDVSFTLRQLTNCRPVPTVKYLLDKGQSPLDWPVSLRSRYDPFDFLGRPFGCHDAVCNGNWWTFVPLSVINTINNNDETNNNNTATKSAIINTR